jgi:ubiquinone/menaquinone biosynthesis C-methylase UbiE
VCWYADPIRKDRGALRASTGDGTAQVPVPPVYRFVLHAVVHRGYDCGILAPMLGAEYKAHYDAAYATGDQDWLARKRALAAADSVAHIRQLVGSDRFNSILDVGAGNGSVLAALSETDLSQQFAAVEISASGLAQIKARQLPRLFDAQVFDGYRIPHDDKAFDLAISVHVIEHVEHERLFLRELARVAKRVCIEVPLDHTLRVRKAIRDGRPHGHINYYTPATVQNLLETSGFRIISSMVTTSSSAYEQFVNGRAKGAVKNIIRRGMLATAPSFAPWLFGSLFAAYCEPHTK